MENAIYQAKLSDGDVPVGCVIKQNGIIIAQAHNMREANCDVTAHAEILAIQQAQKKLHSTRLNDCDIYITLEPCPMCTWAILQAGFKTVFFGSYNLQYGALTSALNLQHIANSKIKVYGGIMEKECNEVLNNFFQKIRKKGIKNDC